MLHQTQYASQFANPFVIEALTRLHGVYVNVYDKEESDEYDEGRDDYVSNPYKYNVQPKYYKIKLLMNNPVQETYDSGQESFDSYMNDVYFITCNKELELSKLQKYEIFYNKCSNTPDRVMQCFEVREFSNAYNKWSVRHIMLKPFN